MTTYAAAPDECDNSSMRLGISGPAPGACLAAMAVFAGGLAHAQLTGVVDIHVHSDPDSLPRSIDAFDLAKIAKQRGIARWC